MHTLKMAPFSLGPHLAKPANSLQRCPQPLAKAARPPSRTHKLWLFSWHTTSRLCPLPPRLLAHFHTLLRPPLPPRSHFPLIRLSISRRTPMSSRASRMLKGSATRACGWVTKRRRRVSWESGSCMLLCGLCVSFLISRSPLQHFSFLFEYMFCSGSFSPDYG